VIVGKAKELKPTRKQKRRTRTPQGYNSVCLQLFSSLRVVLIPF
jgi:hypothetical protein